MKIEIYACRQAGRSEQSMKFTKMHGCGNDYIYVDCTKEPLEDPNGVSVKVSDRHFGIGSDGLICICSSDTADFRMAMYNADGSEGNMCGNGIRCVAKYVYDNKMTDKTTITVETLSGIKTLKLFVENGKVEKVTVNMGTPELIPEKVPVIIPDFAGEIVKEQPITIAVDGTEETRKFTAVSMGNPHAVIRMEEDVRGMDLEKIGPQYENHVYFPDRINTEFIRILNKNEIDMRVWERGSGETLACGTGACASVVACAVNGWTDSRVTVHLLGGDLEINYDLRENTVYMTGPAATVCTGEIDI